MEVESELTADGVVVFSPVVDVDDESVEAAGAFDRLLSDEVESSTEACFDRTLVGEAVVDVRVTLVPFFLTELRGLARPGICDPDAALFSFFSFILACISSPCFSSLCLFSSITAADSAAVSGGLGGPLMFTACEYMLVLFELSPFVVESFPCKSVGSGVKTFLRGVVATLSLLPTASLLCSLEKDGYGRLDLFPFGEIESVRRPSSGMGKELFRGVVRSGLRGFDSESGLPSRISSLDRLFFFTLEDRGFLRSLPSNLESRSLSRTRSLVETILEDAMCDV